MLTETNQEEGYATAMAKMEQMLSAFVKIDHFLTMSLLQYCWLNSMCVHKS